MGNQAEFFEDGGAEHDMLEEAGLDAKDDHTNGHLSGVKPQHDADENGAVNPGLQAVLPNGDAYEDEGPDAAPLRTNAPSEKANENEGENEGENGGETIGENIVENMGVGSAKKKRKSKSKSKSKRGLVISNPNQ